MEMIKQFPVQFTNDNFIWFIFVPYISNYGIFLN